MLRCISLLVALFGDGEVYDWSLQADHKRTLSSRSSKAATGNEVCNPFVPARILTFCGRRLRHEGVERERKFSSLICPAGKSALHVASRCPAPFAKIFRFPRRANHLYKLAPSRPTEGRHAIVTAAGRDAVDADAPITNGTEADGEGVWS
jgi:hypothetical protein